PVLNDAKVLQANWESLQELRRRGHEVLVADGGSMDGTPDMSAPWVDCLVRSAPGRAVQMNAGAAMAGGDILLFLHADTRLPSTADRLILSALRGDRRRWGRFNARLSGDRILFRVIERLMNLRSCLTGICTGDQGIFVDRGVFDAIGGFAEIPLMEDIDISRRLVRFSRPACLRVAVVTSSRRWETHGILRTVCLMWGLRLAYFCGVNPRRLARIYYPDKTE
ncbi:MAG: glycosyltransferase family 2 protein, partial [Gammaproteobacteria bacterium]|nr:glycosyltransferase family 2 protein [Gammaproteobacteria bacterium]